MPFRLFKERLTRLRTLARTVRQTACAKLTDSNGMEKILADVLGTGSVQDSQQADYGGNDAPFWDSVNGNIKNLRAIISGHGKCAMLLRTS